jgi:hypothetical protein
MKNKLFISAVLPFVFAATAHAQLKVTTATGKVKMGQELPVGVGTDDPFNVLSVHVYGMNGDYRAGSKQAFGDFGRYTHWGWNVFIGEYRDYDSDQLWLHGKNGIYLTRGRGDDIIGYYDVAMGNRFTFNCDVYANSFNISSDARFKTDVKNMDNMLNKLMQLQGVSYKLLPKVISSVHSGAPVDNTGTEVITKAKNDAAKGNTDVNPVAPPTENVGMPSKKEMAAQAAGEAYNKKIEQSEPTRLGFIAQDVKKVFPDLVKQDSSNYMYVDYVGLIPVMVEAIKEQQKLIAAKDEQ